MRTRGIRSTLVVLATVALAAAACSSNDTTSPGGGSGTQITGAGATFPDPVYEQWFQDFRQVQPDAQINYQAIGSGGGVEQFTAKTVDFGASDAPLQSDEISALQQQGIDYIEIPTVLGGVVIAYNVSGIDSGLKLDGETAAKIFMGDITSWNDPAIAQLNPDMQLPNTPISVVHRSDESGTTFVFTSWLSAESPTWSKDVGADKAVEWPTGTAGEGNDGVAAAISQTDGSVGYLSFDFAVSSGLGVADIERDDGTFVTPSVETISKAGGDLKFPITPTTNILNSKTKGAYPISTTTYLLLYKDMTDQTKAQTLFDFVTWALTQGSNTATQLNYSPLPDEIAKGSLDALKEMTANGQSLTASMPSASAS